MKYFAEFQNFKVVAVLPETDSRVSLNGRKGFCLDENGNGFQGLDPCAADRAMLLTCNFTLPDDAEPFGKRKFYDEELTQ